MFRSVRSVFNSGKQFSAMTSEEESIDQEAMEKALKRIVPPIARPNYSEIVSRNNFTTTSEEDMEEVANLLDEKQAKKEQQAQEEEEKRQADLANAVSASLSAEGSENASENVPFDDKENENIKASRFAPKNLVLRKKEDFEAFPAEEVKFDNYFMTRFANLVHRDTTSVSRARDAMRQAQEIEKFEYFTLIHKAQSKGKFYFTYQDPTDHSLDKQITYVTDKKGNIETLIAGSKAYALVSPIQKDITDSNKESKYHFHFTHVNMISKFAQMLVLAVHYNRETLPNTQFLEGKYEEGKAIPKVTSIESIKYTQFHEFAHVNGKRVESLKNAALKAVKRRRMDRRNELLDDSASTVDESASLESVDIGEKKSSDFYQRYLNAELKSSEHSSESGRNR